MWNGGNDGDNPPAAFPPLSRQPSIYSLTFDEFQSTMGGIGKDLGSMNMDEFLKNLCTAEESDAMTIGLNSLPRTLSVKTVDEVWRDVITVNAECDGGSDVRKQQRQPTLNEVTLEEFLVRAGVTVSSRVDDCGFGLSFPPVVEAVVGEGKKVNSDGGLKRNGEICSLSSIPYEFNGALRGRKCNGAMEKVLERRQRRMIKNRESAARSRARKQAYTMELEAELATLKEKNQELEKKQAEVFEMQKKQKSNGQNLELLNRQLGPKRSCLRRTCTGPL